MPLNNAAGESGKPKLQGKLSVLLVEDNPDMASTLHGMLEEDGYTVAHANDAAGAQALLRSDPPDIVLLNCHLSGGGMM